MLKKSTIKKVFLRVLGVAAYFALVAISAFNTWGKLLWSEDLTGLRYVTFFSGRGATSMTLFWADRTRGMTLLKSLKNAVDASD
jgi:hypothetical protein